MKLRYAPALALAFLALVAALAGTSYAAVQITSAQIKNNSIKSKDIKDGQVTGKDVKDGSLAGADVADGSVTGADVADGSVTGADVKDGSVTRADLDRSCPSTALPVLGACVDKVSNGTATDLTTALATCDARGARLMTWQEYRVLVTKIAPTAWADANPGNYEVLDLPDATGATAVPQAISYGGSIFSPATGSNLFFRCVTQP